MVLDDLDALLDPAERENAAAGAERPTVLVIDDDPSIVDGLELILSPHYRVVARSSATAGIAALDDQVAVVILDVKMKDRDGFWACDQIRKTNVHLPVIFYSAYQDAKHPIDIINQHQPFGFITKGTSVDVLLELLERAVRYYKLIADGRKMLAELQRLQKSQQGAKEGAAT